MVALGKLEQFDPASNFVAWMGQIVRFVGLNHARRRNRWIASSVDPRSLEMAAASHVDHSTSPLTGRGDLDPLDDSFDDRLLAALQSLDETARSCLLLRTLMDMPYREISLILSIPEGTAMSHVHRARNHLRESLTEMVATPHPAAGATAERNGHIHG